MGKFLLSTLLLLTTAFASTAETVTLNVEDFGFSKNSYDKKTYEDLSSGLTFTISGNSPSTGHIGLSKNSGKGNYIVISANKNNYIIENVVVAVLTASSKTTKISCSKNSQAYSTTNATVTSLEGTKVEDLTLSTASQTKTFEINDLFFGIYNSTNSGAADFSSIKITYATGSSSLIPAGLSFPETAYEATLGEPFTAPVLTKATDAPATYSSSDTGVATVDKVTGEVTLVGAGTTTITAETEATNIYNAGSASYTLTVTKVYKSIAEFYTVGANNKGIIGFPLTVTYVNGTSCYAIYGDEATLIYGKTTYKVGDVIPAGWEGTYSPFNGLDEIKTSANMPASTETAEFTPTEVESVNKDMINQVVVLKNVTFAEATLAGSTKNNFIGTLKNGDEVIFRNNFSDVPSVEAGTYDVKCAISFYVNSKDNSETLQVYPIEYTKVTPISISVPEILINGKEVADLNSTENGTVSFVVADGTEVYYKVETNTSEAMLTAEDDYTKYETPFQIQIGQTVSYYAQSISDPTLRSEITKATATVPTGVEEIEAAGAGEVRWFDMQGREVKGQPEKGIYVRVANGKASKVVL